MSATTSDVPDLAENASPLDTSESLHYAITHVFLPVELPNRNDYCLEKDLSLIRAMRAAAEAYTTHGCEIFEPRWHHVIKMMEKLQVSLQSEHLDPGHVTSELREMQTGDTLTLFIRRQNAAIFLTKRESSTLFELFEVSPRERAVDESPGSLVCSYPWSAIELPDEVFGDPDFQSEFANFISLSNAVEKGLILPPAGYPQYITALLSGVLRGIGRIAEVLFVTKRIRDNVGRPEDNNTAEELGVWRRSSTWLLIRVSMQMGFDRSSPGRDSYKRFMLFFMCSFAKSAKHGDLSNDLLHLMSSKIFRRLGKLGSAAPSWLSKFALETCTCLQEILDNRQMQYRSTHLPCPFWNPSQNELARDTQLSLLGSREYIRNALTGRHLDLKPLSIPFYPGHYRRSAIDDLLSSRDAMFFDHMYDADPTTTLYDVERSVEQEIDEWLVHVTNVNDACMKLETLMDRYLVESHFQWKGNPEDMSVSVLTALELFVALDMLVVREVPMLADYSPEVPIALLESLLLRKATSLHRLSRIYQYLSLRHSQSRPGWSVLSNEFSEDSFPVRYYDQCPRLQSLKARIERDATEGNSTLQQETIYGGVQESQYRRWMDEDGMVSQLRLLASPLHSKVVVFELQCPTYVRIWRSAAPRILRYFIDISSSRFLATIQEHDLLVHVPALRPYSAHHERQSPATQIHLACFDPGNSHSATSPSLRYAIQLPILRDTYSESDDLNNGPESRFSIWHKIEDNNYSRLRSYRISNHSGCSSCSGLEEYVNLTSHNPNGVLATLVNCPECFSLEEFTTFANLRSGGFLQWINILRGLRSRTLNFRRHQVHYILSKAIFQVGPLDLNTGVWIWHQELQDSFFCDALLGELDNLFLDVGTSSIDGMIMSSISVLLTRVIVSSPGEGILDRAITLLWRIRKKTFDWAQELSYNLAKAPTNKERSNLLLDMVTTCRSTFDVDSFLLPRLFNSTEDVDASLSSTLFIRALHPNDTTLSDQYLLLLLQRDYRLSFSLEETLADVILADVSDYGVDHAVQKVFPSHKPSARRWKRLRHRNSRWFTCQTEVVTSQPISQKVHFNLLDGTLLVDGEPVGGLPLMIRDDRRYKEIFRNQGFFVIPSDLRGMDFTTLATLTEYKVHFSQRDGSLVVRAQHNQSKEVLEVIPATELLEDIPPALIFGHVHWLNLSTKIIEIRPLERLWEQSSENWRLDCASEHYRMYKGSQVLVDIRSPVCAMVSKCFESFNNFNTAFIGSETRNLLISTIPIEFLQPVPVLRLSVVLPRYGLSFFSNDQGELESYDFKDMVYDENQSLGTLFGLENFLVLRQKPHLPEEFVPKRVLVPNVRFEKHGGHQVRAVSQYSQYTGPGEPLCHTFEVDSELGCLIVDGNPRTTQLLAYLHAMTSLNKPDLFTGKTGAQAALHLLQSARCRSIMERDTRQFDISQWRGEDNYIVTHYPQIKVAHDGIERRHYIDRYLCGLESISMADKRAMRRAAHSFPPNSTVLATPDSEECDDAGYHIPESDLELEGVAFTSACAVHRWSIHPTGSTISDWATLWNDSTLRTDAASSFVLQDSLKECSTTKPNPMEALHDILNENERVPRRFRLLFLLPRVAYCSSSHQTAFLSMLVVFAKHYRPQQWGNPPIHASCKISDGYRPTDKAMWHHFYGALLRPEEWGPISVSKDLLDFALRDLLKDWPSETLPAVFQLQGSSLWDVSTVATGLQKLFSSCYRNFKLKEHLLRILVDPVSPTIPRPASSHNAIKHVSWLITLDELLCSRPAPPLPSRINLSCDSCKAAALIAPSALNPLFSSITSYITRSSLHQEYTAFLEKSAQCLRDEYSTIKKLSHPDNHIDILKRHYNQCRTRYLDALGTIGKRLGPTADLREQALSQFGQWPPLTADVLLRHLASTSPVSLSREWKDCLVSLALLLLDLQRARRLLRFALDGLEEEFSKELENEGCDGWNPEEYPDWLLIQTSFVKIQGNFLIRRFQAEIAMEIMFPQTGENTVMQVNMGEGKSSVIVPIAAAALANEKQLVRVIVPKNLTKQMFELLVSRLGGLANRPIYFLPFSRPRESTSSSTNQTERKYSIDDLQNIAQYCMKKRIILLVQPEHVASLRLMSVEAQTLHKDKSAIEIVPNHRKLIYRHVKMALSFKLPLEHTFVGNMFRSLTWPSNHFDITQTDYHDERDHDAKDVLDSASKWLNLQKWFHSHARDILDESDQILNPRLQLIYTIGLQQHVDGYPNRWVITQQVLNLVKKHAYSLSTYAPDLIQCERGQPGLFPYIHILRPIEVGRHLVSAIVEDVMSGQLPNFNFKGASPALHDAIRSFISDEDVLEVPGTAKRVEEYANLCSQQVWKGLLLLRGLLTSNVLMFALAERRWRVDYGLAVLPSYTGNSSASASTMLAVPYRAKDTPAPNTSFGHPDIAIILTCLSYYYGGLDEKELRTSFELLLDEDDPSTEYAHWIKEYGSVLLPDSLRTLVEVNLKSSEEWDEVIFPLFARNRGAIDFYLSRVVFPREMKEYPWKLCASSWDLAEKREKLITGFAGTNDGRWLLPMTIAQRDPDHQQGTNARVLAYLLRPENDFYAVTHESEKRRNTTGLLQTIATQEPRIRILLDVGAQILDLSNRQVAKKWLDIARDAAGALFFNEDDILTVLVRNGSDVPLLSSPLSQQLGRCIIYLDQAHTRGTDIKLPNGSRAAVTLGPKVTKDCLVQGCMRMRKLGHGHSVMFFAPPEVDRSIRAVAGKKDATIPITTVDILSWAINETCLEIEQRAPYWAQQGMDHKSRYNAWSDFASEKSTREKLLDTWLQPENKSLEDLYAPSEDKGPSSALSQLDPEIRQRCKNLGVLSLPYAEMTEEQEREVMREREREREVELPPSAVPSEHFVHPDVFVFVKTGSLPPLNMSTAFHPVFTTLGKSSAATQEGDVWSPFILATTDFCNTIKPESTQGTIDQYLRPVQWILSRTIANRDPILVLLSPFEVSHLMADIRASEFVHLHLYAPRTSERMKPSDDLKLYTIPPLPSDWTPPWALIDQLNVFAGQLYLRDYASYLRLCRLLGVPTKEIPNESDTALRWNLFNIPGSLQEDEIRFTGSPLPFVMALLSIRSRGRPFSQTHMGQILQGNLLTERDFDGT